MVNLNDNKYGDLITPAAKLHRRYFSEMCKLIGIKVIYRSPKEGKHYTTRGEIESNYNPPMLVGCIFDEHPAQQTLKKMGWMTELQESSSFIHVDYDLPGLQLGALFLVPSGLDNTQARLFRVVRIMNSFIYPSSITCEIIPEWESDFDPTDKVDYTRQSFNLLNREEDD